MNPRRQRALWAAATAAGVLLVFAPATLGLRTLSQRDTDRLYAPVRTLVVQELRAGRLPLWNPYEGTGKPLFAEGIHSVLHPISLAGAFLAPSSIDFLIVAYLVSAALGSFVLARTLGASPPASAGAGLAFALGGFSVSMTGNLVFLAGISTLPWLVAAARAAGAGSRFGPTAAALATACAFLSGDAQAALVGLALGLVLAADAGGRRGAARALAGMCAGILLAGVQIAATLALLPRTYRSVDLPSGEATRWAFEPARVLEWVVPGLFRGPISRVPLAASGAWLPPVFSESVYLGMPLLAAAVAALRGDHGRRRTALGLSIAAAVLLWLALGHRAGARQLLAWVPVWSRFRYAEKLMAPLALCVSALGALGVDALGARRLGRGARRALAAAGIASAAALAALLAAPDATRDLSMRLLGDPGPFYRSTLAAGLPHLAIGLGALLAADRLRPAPARTVVFAALVALAPAAAVHSGAHLGSPDVRRFASRLGLRADSPAPRVVHPEDPMHESSDPAGPVDAVARIHSTLLSPALNVASRVDSIEPYGAFKPGRVTTLAMSFGGEWARAFRRFGVTHVVSQLPRFEAPGPAYEGARLVQRDEALGFEVREVPHRPWAFFAGRAVATGLPQDAHRLLLGLMHGGDDDTVIVESAEVPATSPGRVLRLERGIGKVRVEAEAEGPALLVVQDAFWPGWRATVDGVPAPILAADVLVRAVRWPAGRHWLEMTYDPPEIRAGLAVSALGAFLVAVLAVLALRRGSPTDER